MGCKEDTRAHCHKNHNHPVGEREGEKKEKGKEVEKLKIKKTTHSFSFPSLPPSQLLYKMSHQCWCSQVVCVSDM